MIQDLIEENPTLNDELKSKGQLLTAINTLADQLRTRHLEEAKTLDYHAAFEIALHEIRSLILPQDSPFHLDDAMAYLRSLPA